MAHFADVEMAVADFAAVGFVVVEEVVVVVVADAGDVAVAAVVEPFRIHTSIISLCS